jgi:hypothetical protein
MTLSVSTLLEHMMPSLLSAVVKSCVTALVGVLALSGAWAQTTMSKDNSPGWYRMHIGSFEITALSDGTLDLPVDQLFPKVDPGRIQSLLARSFLASNVSLTVNAFLVNTGTRLVLIDTGTGRRRRSARNWANCSPSRTRGAGSLRLSLHVRPRLHNRRCARRAGPTGNGAGVIDRASVKVETAQCDVMADKYPDLDSARHERAGYTVSLRLGVPALAVVTRTAAASSPASEIAVPSPARTLVLCLRRTEGQRQRRPASLARVSTSRRALR